jgi:DNA-binding LacI/PurR family transcriptional regulator
MIAKTLVGELSRMVAVLAPNLGSPFHVMLFRGINEVLEYAGWHILFHNVHPDESAEADLLANLLSYHPAGYIVLKGAEGRDFAYLREISVQGIPLVTQGRLDDIETHAVSFDDRLGMRKATDYVIAKGHHCLGYLAGPPFSQSARDRKLGFIESLIEHDIPVSGAVMIDAGETAAEGYRAALDALNHSSQHPTALLCFNDMVAMGAYRAAHELHLKVPDDLSLMGFDGIDFAGLFGPPLTSVNIFPEELGRRLASLLLRVIKKEVGRSKIQEWIQPEILERASVRGLGAAATETTPAPVETVSG